ncbi:MAG: DUF4293 family protein [Bacteroidetes bacterium]|nr:DUF4293 family protein [Bacteroidota bacterium]MCY4233017.1 DUF4293 family protein [Bacteroidota bacterium]
MGHQHSYFIALSGASYVLISLDINSRFEGLAEFMRISLIVLGVLILITILFHGNSKLQLQSLKISQIIVIALSGIYYYSLWVSDVFDQWLAVSGSIWGLVISGALPIIGYISLSLSVRILNRNLKLIRNVDRLRD